MSPCPGCQRKGGKTVTAQQDSRGNTVYDISSRRPACNGIDGLVTSDYEESEMTYPNLTEPATLAGDIARWMSTADGCPSCVANLQPPNAAYPLLDGGYVAYYRCADCGHTWSCNWAEGAA